VRRFVSLSALFQNEAAAGKPFPAAILDALPASAGAVHPERRGTPGPLDRGKENPGTVTAYEIMLLLDSELADERQNEILARARELVEKRGGVWQNHEPWGRRRLAYEIEHKQEAYYHLIHLDCDAETLEELTRVLKITDGVTRHLAVRRPAAAPPRPPREAVPAGR
jgi:small subunit ribosomal protein S6